MELAAKAVIIALCGALMTLLIKRTNPELSLLLSMAVSVVITVMALKIFSEIRDVINLANLSMRFSKAYTEPVLKCVGIGLVARLGADLCKDAGQTAAASSVEICGAMCAIFAALPLLKTFLQMIGELA